MKRSTASRRKLPPRVLIFGEDRHDGDAIRELIKAISPSLPVPTVLREPVVYIKGADPAKIKKNADKIAGAVDAEREKGPIKAIFVHQDCDACEPAHVPLARTIEGALAVAGVENGHAVTPAWELETWWLLWPKAVKAVSAQWRAPDQYSGKDLGRIRDAKEVLKRAIRPAGLKKDQKFHEYTESDSPLIAAKVRELGLIDAPTAQSASFEAFRAVVKAL